MTDQTNKIGPRGYEDCFEPTPWGFGSAHSVSSETPDRDRVAELYAVVEEVTGKRVEPPTPPRIGFY